MLIEDPLLCKPYGQIHRWRPEGRYRPDGTQDIVDSYGGWARQVAARFQERTLPRWTGVRPHGAMGGEKRGCCGTRERCESSSPTPSAIPKPVSVNIDTFDTNAVPEEAIERAVKTSFHFKPADIIAQLDLLRPIYRRRPTTDISARLTRSSPGKKRIRPPR